MLAKKICSGQERFELQVTRVGAILQNATGYRTKLEGLSSFCFDEIDVHVWNAHEAGHSAQRSEISVVTDCVDEARLNSSLFPSYRYRRTALLWNFGGAGQ